MDPISRPAKPYPKPSRLRYYGSLIVFYFVLFYCSTSLVLVQLMAQFIILAHYPLKFVFPKDKQKIKEWFYNQYRKVIIVTERSFGSMIIFLCSLLSPGTQLVLTGDHELLKETEKAILIANHQIYPDWLYLWALARQFGRHGDLKIMLIAVLKYLPIFGLGMTFFEFIFMKQKLAKDRATIIKHMTRQKTLWKDFPLWLLIFPEGTLNTPNNRLTSRAYAKKVEISEDPKYVLLPKATGLFMVADALSDQLDVVFDLTVGYSGLDPEDIPYEEYLIDKVFFSGYYPKQIHINVKKIALHSIPGLNSKDTGSFMTSIIEKESKGKSAESLQSVNDIFDARSSERRQQLSDWLKDLFMKKDYQMKHFYEKKCFPGSSTAITLKPTLYDWVVILSIGACSWVIIPFWWKIFETVFEFLYKIYSDI